MLELFHEAIPDVTLPKPTLTKYSKVQSPPIFPSSNRQVQTGCHYGMGDVSSVPQAVVTKRVRVDRLLNERGYRCCRGPDQDAIRLELA